MDGPPPPLPVDAEIANLEHELAYLRDREATMHVAAKRVRITTIVGFWMLVIAVVAAVIYASVTGNEQVLVMLLLAAILLGAMGIAGWLCKSPDWGYIYSRFGYPFDTNKEFLEHAIAVREERLKELKENR